MRGPVNEDEYAILLQTIRRLARDHGRSDLDTSLFVSRLQDTSSNREAVLAYLSGLRDDVALRNERTLRNTMSRLAAIPTEDGGFVEGIVVEINEQDRAVFDGQVQVDLLSFSETGDALIDLGDLLAEIEADEGDG
jgi:hypothetical protein